MKRLWGMLCLGLAIGLIVAACGGSEASKEDLVVELVAQNLFTQEQAECFVDAIWDDIGPLDVDALAGGGDLSAADQDALTSATLTCLGFGEDGGATGVPGSPSDFSPDDPPPGDDAELDALWVACGAGDAEACDELFFTSDSGSDYESFGLTCGGRGNGDCATVIGNE